MKPLRDVIIIEADEAEKKTKTGILLTEEWKTLPPLGKVTAVGPKVKTIKVGDRVLFNRYAATILEGQTRLITEGDVLATVEETADVKTD